MNELQAGTDLIRADTDELLQRFRRYIARSDRTFDTYRKALKQFFTFLSCNGIGQPTRDDVERWRDQLQATHAPAGVNVYLSAVKVFFAWTDDAGIYPDIAHRVKRARIDAQTEKSYLTAAQCRRILESMNGSDTEQGLRDLAMLSLLITTGTRTIELQRADVGDLRNVGDCKVLFIRGKGRTGKGEYVKLAPRTETALINYLSTRNAKADQPLFTSTSNRNQGGRLTTRSISRIVKHAMICAGYTDDRLTAHSTRHTAAILNLSNGGTLEETQVLLRHADINTTRLYTHSIERQNNNSETRIENAIFREGEKQT